MYNKLVVLGNLTKDIELNIGKYFKGTSQNPAILTTFVIKCHGIL